MWQGCFSPSLLSRNFDDRLSWNFFTGLLSYAYAEIQQVRRLVFDNYQKCPLSLMQNIFSQIAPKKNPKLLGRAPVHMDVKTNQLEHTWVVLFTLFVTVYKLTVNIRHVDEICSGLVAMGNPHKRLIFIIHTGQSG